MLQSIDYRTNKSLLLGLSVVALSALVVLSGILTHHFPITTIAIPSILLVGIIGATLSPLTGFILFIFFVFLENNALSFYLLSSGKIHLRLDEIYVLGLAIATFAKVPSFSQLKQKILSIPGMQTMLLYLGFAIITTIINHRILQTGIDDLIILVIGVLCFAMASILIQEITDPLHAIISLLILGNIEALIGIVSYFINLSYYGGSVINTAYNNYPEPKFGSQIEPSSGYLEAIGTAFEGNIFGQIMAAFVIVSFIMLIFHLIQRRHWDRFAFLYTITLLITGTGLYVSYSRGSWLMAIIGSGIGCLITFISQRHFSSKTSNNRTLFGKRTQILILFAAAIVVAILLLSPVQHIILNRVSNLFVASGDTTTNVRLQNIQGALQEWLEDPIIGTGIGSAAFPLPGNAPPWILSLGLSVLHDTGIIGIIVFGIFLWHILRAVIVQTRKTTSTLLKGISIALTLALLSFLFAAQLTNTIYLNLFWFFTGLVAGIPGLLQQKRPIEYTFDFTQIFPSTRKAEQKLYSKQIPLSRNTTTHPSKI